MQRRDFIKNTATAAAGITILNFPVFGKSAPSNKIILAVAGVNSRGSYLAENFLKRPNVEFAYLCDVEEGAIKKGMEKFKDAERKPTIIKDIRQLVTKKDFDALIVATPDHWHTPAALLAISNNKHVYVEKPGSHNAHEAELIANASKKYKKLVQLGNQRRSMPTLQEAVKKVREGAIGNVYFGKAWYSNNRKPIGTGKKIAVPSTLDFDLWQGVAPRKPYLDNIVHYNWHWRWNWGTGEVCNNGTHEIDCCRWFLNVDYPSVVSSTGGRYTAKDDWEAPDTQVANFEFGNNKLISWEGRSCNIFPVEGSTRGFIIYGDKGTLVNKGGGDYSLYDENKKLISEVKPGEKTDGTNTVSATGNLDLYHMQNFINSIKGETVLNSPISETYKSVLLCHLANISVRTGQTLNCDPSNGHLLNTPAAQKLWRREYEKSFASSISGL
ncbi:MAG: Gfo/Idh/MocA family oxidoreductase [Chitinophagaceae bacterium]|nr:Gfo/Idh/MocA family oxidoreductase [Chitinophagaceae bacterium]